MWSHSTHLVLLYWFNSHTALSCADSSKNKKKAVNNAPVPPVVSLGNRWCLLVFDNYSWGKPSSLACLQVRWQRCFLLYVGLLWLSSSGSASHLFNQLQHPGWIDSCECLCFLSLLQVSFKARLYLCVDSQVSLLEREFSALLRWFFVCLEWCLVAVWIHCEALIRLMVAPGVVLS